jgi:hypothetical protein
MNLLMNFERPTSCRYHIPHVVAYVVGYVEGLVVYSGLAEASTDPVGAFGIQSRALSSYTVCMKNKRHLPDERPSRARDHADLRRCRADVPGKEGHVSAYPRCEESQARLRRWNPDHVRTRRKQTNSC